MDEHCDSTECIDLAGSLGLMALHWGRIEPGTEEIARFVAHRSSVSLYVYSGRRPVGNRALHRPSHRLELNSRPLLLRFLNHVKAIISLHGHGREHDCAYVGGLNQVMRQRFLQLAREALPQYVWVADLERIPVGLRGVDPDNIVNLPPSQGMQLELPRPLRQSGPGLEAGYLEPEGDAVVLSRLLIRFVDTVLDAGN
ncbi:MAG: poly-gamma-glutamate hydrolase family protein [Syntrophobacteria bacterium]